MVANYKESCKRLALKRLLNRERMPPNKRFIGDRIGLEAKTQGYKGDVFCGLIGNDLKQSLEQKNDFIYIDHSYFQRGWSNQHFRACRNWVHHTTLLKRPDDRLKKFEVKINPWMKTGRKVAVIPNTHFQISATGYDKWTEETIKRLKQITSRPVEVREKGHAVPLNEYLQDVWAVVTWGSVAGVEAALLGVPVFAAKTCPAYPVSAGPLEKIETPEYAENRYEWKCSWAYASWHWDEIKKIDFKDYAYSLREGA